MKLFADTKKTSRALSLLAALIIVLLPFHEFITTWVGSNTAHLDLLRIWKEILICLMAVPTVVLIFRQPDLKRWFFKSWIVRLYGLYVLLHLVLGAWALHAHQVNRVALIYGLIVNLRFIGFFLVCLAIAALDDFLRRTWAKLLLGPAAVVVVFGLAQRLFLPYDFLKHFGYGPKTIPAYETVDSNLNYRRIQSTLRGSDPLGAYLVLIGVAAMGVLKRRVLKFIYALAVLAAIFFSYSRSAWIGLVLAIGFLIYMGGRKINRRLLYAVLTAVVILAGVLYAFRGHQSIQDTLLHTSNNSQSSVSSNAQRSLALKNGLRDVLHQPLGRGPGTAGPASTRNDHPARIAENYYLQIGQEVGVIGIVIFVLINFLVARQLWRNRQDNLSRILLASLLGISFINLLSHAWADDTLSLLWWGLAGIALAPSLASRATPAKKPVSS